MSRLLGWWTRLRRTLRPARFDAEMEEEMRAHRELEAQALARSGMTADEARRHAAIAFGSAEAQKEQVRDRRLGRTIHEFAADTRYAFRQFRNAPGFTAIAMATLALGIGASTAVFSMLDGLLLRPMPYPEPDRVALLLEVIPKDKINNASGGAFIDWRTHQRSFEAICLTSSIQKNIRYGTTLERLEGAEVTHEYFGVFRIKPILGRTFLDSEDKPGGDNRVVVITEDYWKTRFGASQNVLGATVVVDEIPHTVIGVVPSDYIEPDARFYVPAVAQAEESGKYSRTFHWAVVVGRLLPGVSLAQAEADLKGIKERLQPQYPVWKKDWSVAVRAPRPLMAQNTAPVLAMLGGAVGLVLLISCANVANLLLAKGTQREKEMALRTALGASRGRLMRQVLTESVWLALIGGAAGVMLSAWGIDVLRGATAKSLPPALAPQLDWRVLGTAVGVSVLTGIIFGTLPAWRSGRASVNDALKNGGRSATSSGGTRTQATLVVAEVALTFVLLTAAGLLLRSLTQLVTADPGFQPAQALAFDLSLPQATYPTPESRFAFSQRLQERLRALPGVENVGTAMSLPFAGGGYGENFARGDRTPTYDDPGGRVDYVSPGYLQTLGARLLAGRWLDEKDNRADGPRVAIVNERVAQTLYPGEMPVGKQIRVSGVLWEIVGVIATVPGRSKDATSTLFAYFPQAFDSSSYSVVVRSSAPASLVPAVRSALRELDQGLPMANVRTLDQAMYDSLKLRRTVLGVIGAFAGASLILACIGLYGVMSYSVSTRTRELSIRMALGAERRDLVKMVMGEGFRMVLVGLVIGVGVAAAVTRLLNSQLYATSGYDPLVWGCCLLVFCGVAAFACWWPARRATRTDALAALRAD
jgi:predicted permease